VLSYYYGSSSGHQRSLGKGIYIRYRHITPYSGTRRILQLQRRFLCHTQKGRTAYRPRTKPALTDFGLQPNSHTQPWSAVRWPPPRIPCNNMDHYLFTDSRGMESWVGLVDWAIADSLPTKWSPVNRGSGMGQGKSAIRRRRPNYWATRTMTRTSQYRTQAVSHRIPRLGDTNKTVFAPIFETCMMPTRVHCAIGSFYNKK